MKALIAILMLTLALPFAASGKEQGRALSVDTIQVLKIAGQDGRAVIKTPDGKKQIIKVGDPIGDHAKVTEISAGRVVIEEQKGSSTEKVIIRLENDKQHVERVRQAGDVMLPIYSAAKSSQERPTLRPAVPEKQPTAAGKEKKGKKEDKEKQKKKSKKMQEKKNDSERSSGPERAK